VTHHRISQTGRNSWTAPTGYQHGSRFGGAFRSTRKLLAMQGRDFPIFLAIVALTLPFVPLIVAAFG
jgi:hypothetical protein